MLNTSDVGLDASLVFDAKTGSNAIRISSKATGLADGEDKLFNISSSISWRELNTLGIDNISHLPTNSAFKLNGTTHESLSNTFTVNKAYELVLKSPTNGEVTIGLMNDTEALSNGLNQLLDSYNGMLDIGLRYNGAHQNRTLFNEISSIARNQAGNLSDSLNNIADYLLGGDLEGRVSELASHILDKKKPFAVGPAGLLYRPRGPTFTDSEQSVTAVR